MIHFFQILFHQQNCDVIISTSELSETLIKSCDGLDTTHTVILHKKNTISKI